MKLQSGLGNHLESEALPGVLPVGQNSPQQVARGLYAEQLNGTAFTAPRHRNLKTWLYKIRPSVVQGAFVETGHATWITDPGQGNFIRTPEALRFQPFPHASSSKDFLESLFTYAMNGSPFNHTGCALHLYAFNRSMDRKHLYNADAEMMIVPESGTLVVRTELGVLEVGPRWIAVIPRGMKFRVDLAPGSNQARGYVCENFGAPFQLPELGPIGANGLANPSDFEVPQASFEQVSGEHELFARYQGSLWRTVLEASPLDTVAWRGNYVPYRYDLGRFNTINTVSFDHPDPSIFTVLTSPSAVPGTANVDFVIFPPRWMVAEHTFRPPYYHRNVMNEFMGLIAGKYDAKEEGFLPGGASLHNAFTGHGPDADAFCKATDASTKLEPVRYENTLAFMWESQYPFWPSEQAMKRTDLLDRDYRKCWEGLKPGLEK
jgi:homogentisate 1,2-dioxygenase